MINERDGTKTPPPTTPNSWPRHSHHSNLSSTAPTHQSMINTPGPAHLEGASTPSFQSNFSAFNLPPPRHVQQLPPTSPGVLSNMQVDQLQMDLSSAYPLFHRRVNNSPSTSPSSGHPFIPTFPFSSAPFRKQSMLATEPLLPPASLSPPEGHDDDDSHVVDECARDEQPRRSGLSRRTDEDGDGNEAGGEEGGDMDREGSDSPMVLGSPSFEPIQNLPPYHPLTLGPPAPHFATRQTRSRSTSDSISGVGNGSLGGGTVPPSPVLIARALQGQQRTPPPFLQRRLYNEMQEDGGGQPGPSSLNINPEGFSRRGLNLGPAREIIDDDEERDSGSSGSGLVSAGGGGGSGSGSASGSGEEGSGRVVRRPVSRKPNLLPKPKSHLRVMAELKNEDGPADQLEIASEATLHRLSRSGASTVPPVRSSSSLAAPSFDNGGRPTSSHGPTSGARPTPNRFPEQAADDEEALDSNSSGEEVEDIGEAGSDWGGMSLGGYGTEDEEERKASSIWTGIRGSGPSFSGGVPPNLAMAVGKSPGSERGRMEIEGVPSTPSWSASGRPGKRKMTDDRFEPYAFKRRAVSPASGGSPILFSHSHPSMPTPPPLPMPIAIPNSNLTLPISIPSPTLGPHHTFFSALSGPANNGGRRSRAASPVASSLSSSAGRGSFFGGSQALGMMMREDERSGIKASEAGDQLGSMSLG
ncbi:hypothetical protein T439DRAFT_378948 [Meredithblackwellia eburnea MCA 4105]